MERYLDDQSPEILEITTEGLDFYGDMFAQPYPFAKYDQVFVPEYNSGAMENVGCVTYNEAYLFRDPATESQKLDRAETFLHELAHMWFGNLVTMRWWDDLWLNESFATYISYLAMTEATRFTNAWKVFNADIKRWAYQQDQLPTTHPIAGEAPDTEIAFLNFDGITYGKGASILKQLVKYIGRDAFRDGLRIYFGRYGWSNATLDEFLGSLEESSGSSLQEWARLWLRTASLNTLSTEWQADGDRITALAIQQTASTENPTLRPHALELALAKNGPQAAQDRVDLGLDRRTGHTDCRGARTRGAGSRLPELRRPRLRQGVPRSSVGGLRAHPPRPRSGRAAPRAAVDVALGDGPRPRAAVDRVPGDCPQRAARRARSRRRQHGARPRRIGRKSVPAGVDPRGRVAQLVRGCPQNVAKTNGDPHIMWARSAINSATTTADVARLAELVDGSGSLPVFSEDQEMRWAIATKGIAYGLPDAEERLARETERDRSDRGRRALLRAEASRPSSEAKADAWSRIHGDGYGSFHLTRAAMMGFFWPGQDDVVEEYVDRFFSSVREVFETRDHPFARSYLLAMYPAYRADPIVLERSKKLLSSLNGSLPTLSRQLAEVADDLDRQIKVRAFAESSA